MLTTNSIVDDRKDPLAGEGDPMVICAEGVQIYNVGLERYCNLNDDVVTLPSFCV